MKKYRSSAGGFFSLALAFAYCALFIWIVFFRNSSEPDTLSTFSYLLSRLQAELNEPPRYVWSLLVVTAIVGLVSILSMVLASVTYLSNFKTMVVNIALAAALSILLLASLLLGAGFPAAPIPAILLLGSARWCWHAIR